jgi:apolipoprotein N-acyltransferase
VRLRIKQNFEPKINLITYFLLGCAAAASFEVPTLFVVHAASFFAFFWFLDRDRGSNAFIKGYLFGFGFFLVSVWWLMFVRNYYFLPILLALFEALFFAVPAHFSKIFFKDKNPFRFVILGCLLIVFEFLRGYGRFGFPWMSTGFFLSDTFLKKSLQIFGIYGAGWMLILSLSFLATMLLTRKRAIGFLLFVFSVALLAYPSLNKDLAPKREINAVLLQSSVLPEEKHHPDSDLRLEIMLNSFKKMEEMLPKNFDLAVFPETSFPLLYPFDSRWQSHFLDLSRTSNSLVILGAETFEEGRYYNSLHFFDHGRYIGRYDKKNLVPFGEYVPFRERLRFIPIVRNSTDFSAGSNDGIVKTSLGKIGCGICWESAIPSFGRDLASKGAEILIFSTNDNWFGFSNQNSSHWRHTRAQADASGLCVVQAANAGITGFYDGIRRKTLEPWMFGSLMCSVPIRKPDLALLDFQKRFESTVLLTALSLSFLACLYLIKK